MAIEQASHHYPPGIDQLRMVDSMTDVDWTTVTDPGDLRNGIWTAFQNLLPDTYRVIPQPTSQTITTKELQKVEKKFIDFVRTIDTVMGEYGPSTQKDVNGNKYVSFLYRKDMYDMVYAVQEWICGLEDSQITERTRPIQYYLNSFYKKKFPLVLSHPKDAALTTGRTHALTIIETDIFQPQKQSLLQKLFPKPEPIEVIRARETWNNIYWKSREYGLESDIRNTVIGYYKMVSNLGNTVFEDRVHTVGQKIKSAIGIFECRSTNQAKTRITVEGMINFGNPNIIPCAVGKAVSCEEGYGGGDFWEDVYRKRIGVMQISRLGTNKTIESIEMSSIDIDTPQLLGVHQDVLEFMSTHLIQNIQLKPTVFQMPVDIASISEQKIHDMSKGKQVKFPKTRRVGVTIAGKPDNLMLLAAADLKVTNWEVAVAMGIVRNSLFQYLPEVFTLVRTQGRERIYRYSDAVCQKYAASTNPT